MLTLLDLLPDHWSEIIPYLSVVDQECTMDTCRALRNVFALVVPGLKERSRRKRSTWVAAFMQAASVARFVYYGRAALSPIGHRLSHAWQRSSFPTTAHACHALAAAAESCDVALPLSAAIHSDNASFLEPRYPSDPLRLRRVDLYGMFRRAMSENYVESACFLWKRAQADSDEMWGVTAFHFASDALLSRLFPTGRVSTSLEWSLRQRPHFFTPEEAARACRYMSEEGARLFLQEYEEKTRELSLYLSTVCT